LKSNQAEKFIPKLSLIKEDVRPAPIPTKNTPNILQKSRTTCQVGSVFHGQPFQHTNQARKTRESDLEII